MLDEYAKMTKEELKFYIYIFAARMRDLRLVSDDMHRSIYILLRDSVYECEYTLRAPKHIALRRLLPSTV